MLRGGDNGGVPAAAASEVEERVLDIVAETSGVLRADVWRGMPLATALDSLTLAAVVTRTEAAFGVGFSTEETLALLGASDLGELCSLVARKVSRERESR